MDPSRSLGLGAKGSACDILSFSLLVGSPHKDNWTVCVLCPGLLVLGVKAETELANSNAVMNFIFNGFF